MEKEVKVGSIFVMSWGYDQTNVDFYQVVALKGKTQCVVRGICGRPKEMGRDEYVPVPDSFVGKEIVKKINYYQDYRPWLTMTSFASARLCDPKEGHYQTPAGFGH